MKKVLKYFLVLVFFASFAAYLLFASKIEAKNRETIVCNEIRINITDSATCAFITPSDIKRYITGSYGKVIGMQVDNINNYEIENLLKSKAAIKNCESYTDRTGTLHIKVSQRRPAIRLEAEDWKRYVDEDGFIFPIEGSYTAMLPIITGDIPISMDKVHDGKITDPTQEQWLNNLLALIEFIESDSYWNSMITQIDIRGKEIYLSPAIGNLEIEFGGFEDTANKFYRIQRFYNTIYPGSEESYSRVSVKYKDQIICKKNKENTK